MTISPNDFDYPKMNHDDELVCKQMALDTLARKARMLQADIEALQRRLITMLEKQNQNGVC
jgi:chaperonin cofactor prefoldin